MAKIDVEFMKGNRTLAKAMGSTYKKSKKTTSRKGKGNANGKGRK